VSTAVKTLGDLKAHRMALNARCTACGHRRDLNTDDLIKRLGADWVFIGKALDKALRCTECDNLGATVQVRDLDAGRRGTLAP
jgi:DNA-directed RNA polymerase subunit RPC12/RpoP